jgi:hypothetical protein
MKSTPMRRSSLCDRGGILDNPQKTLGFWLGWGCMVQKLKSRKKCVQRFSHATGFIIAPISSLTPVKIYLPLQEGKFYIISFREQKRYGKNIVR